jgi:hypothetical protein
MHGWLKDENDAELMQNLSCKTILPIQRDHLRFLPL